MTADELINDYIDDCVRRSSENTVIVTNDIIETLIKTPKDEIIKDLISALDNYSYYYSVCPKCGHDLEVLHKDYEPSEYQGKQVNEEINTWGCNECGWIKED